MATITVPQVTQTTIGDNAANPNTLVLRDSSSGIYGALLQGSTLQSTGNLIIAVTNKTADFTAGASVIYTCDTSGGSITVTLPLASANAGVCYIFYKTSASNTLTFTGVTGTGSLSSVNTKAIIFSNGTSWYSAI